MKGAAAGMLGIAGITAGAKTATASETSEGIHAQAANRVTVRGVADRTRYIIYSTKPIWGGDGPDENGTDSSFEYPQAIKYDGTWYDYGLDGTVYANYEDTFYFHGYIDIPPNDGITYTIEDR
ncbi:hypothetical protein [Halocatena halophila]|uniref:hypothetical protein n=1 Tax=Halocatena halophila TaxID=2814576 RepID=UPI002ED62F11